jgi:very-short-patch-repair endonuclease
MQLSEKLHSARKELLDMSLRNPLLHYKPLKSKGLEIKHETPLELYRLLVDESKSMSFLTQEDLNLNDVEEDSEEYLKLLSEAYSDLKIGTDYSEKELQDRLLKTYLAAKTFIEERGVNTLFLALGAICWNDGKDAQKFYKAPLIMIPVQITRSNARERFVLSYTGEDIQYNMSMASKLSAEHSIILDVEPEELHVSKYFQKIKEALVSFKDWYVDETFVQLGFFSFGKYLMYLDLDVDKWPSHANPDRHPLMQAILGEGFREPESPIDENALMDKFVNPRDVYSILEADSSQLLSLLDVASGRNLVIQGPPGTGKSQTITNIIAHAVAKGKKILFVSEKLAALEVVKRRLDNHGIGEVCLELHSHKLNKKVLLHNLKETLDLGAPLNEPGNEIFLRFETLRDSLNLYCDALHAPIANTSVSPYKAYGEILRIKNIFDAHKIKIPQVLLPGIETMSDDVYMKTLFDVKNFKEHIKSMGLPIHHPFWGSMRTLFLPQDQEQLTALLWKAQDSLQKLSDFLKSASKDLPAPFFQSLNSAKKLLSSLETYSLAPDLLDVDVTLKEDALDESTLIAFLENGIKCKNIFTQHGNLLMEEACNQDVLSIRQSLSPYLGQWWKWFSGTYRNANTQFMGLLKTPQKLRLENKISILDDILAFQKAKKMLDNLDASLQNFLGKSYKGLYDTNWDGLNLAVQWLLQTKKQIRQGDLFLEILTWAHQRLDENNAKYYISALSELIPTHLQAMTDVFSHLEMDLKNRFSEEDPLEDASFDTVFELLKLWLSSISQVQNMVLYNHFTKNLSSDGLEGLCHLSAEWEYSGQFLDEIYAQVRYNALLKIAFENRPALAFFERANHEDKIQQFHELDEKIKVINKLRILQYHFNQMPKTTSNEGQLGILLWEFQKKARHLPIRKLMSKAGNVIQAIKPVMMMSPLSIANFIEPGCLEFDLVIFDEASQVRPVESFGAIMRSKQAVVVGDSCQMPPTIFFDHLMDLGDEEDETYLGDMESILGLFVAKNSPQRTLRWHYRSKHESLIAVSNYEFYHNKLVVFPSPHYEDEQLGLIYHYLPNSGYDRGKTRTNKEEAKEVALAVVAHAKKTPHLSLGVAAFSMAQMQAILDIIEIYRRQDPNLEKFFVSHHEEPFFVKNLENVQGDERDVIFISIGYGKTVEGYISMDFGPLNREGGERRLNVLITRAKQRCEVFTNLLPEDIDLNRSQSRGVSALKTFLQYAKNRILDSVRETQKEADSEFENQVFENLTALGYVAKKQVGSAGFYIDLAIVDPKKPGKFLLGIECDGASYHRSRSAKDRDKLRQAVLEGKGWTIYRIWSTDYFRNPQGEMEKLDRFLKDLEASESSRIQDGSLNISTDSQEASTSNSILQRGDSASPPKPDVFVDAYQLAEGLYCNEQILYNPSLLKKLILDIVAIESPIHEDDLLRRIVLISDAKKAGRLIKESVAQAILLALMDHEIRRQEGFLWSKEMTAPKLRNRQNLASSSKKLQWVAPEEYELAILSVVKNNFGMQRNELPLSVCKLLGFARATDEMVALVNSRIDALIAKNALISKESGLLHTL